MSSIAIMQQRDAVHLVTDAAHYTSDGLVVQISSKVTELPASNSVFSIRGAGYADRVLGWLLYRFASFDDAIEALPGVMSVADSVFLTFADSGASPVQRHFVLTIAGWSDRLQCMATVAAATYEHGDPADTEGWMTGIPGYRQYSPVYMPAMGAMPPVDVAQALGRTLVELEDGIEDIDVAADALAIFEAQRVFPSFGPNSAQYVVGGFAELTTVTRDGIARRILKEYPDQVGKFIVPDGAEPVAEVWARELEWREANPERAAAMGQAVGKHPPLPAA
jgi:hypothetical protein